MRRASQGVGIFADSGNLALSFGYDYCAEHEWGTTRLNRIFGVSNDEDDATVQRFAITRVPEGSLHLIEAGVSAPDWTSGRRKALKHRRLFLLGGDVHLYKQTPEEFAVGYRDSYFDREKSQAHWGEEAFMFSVPADDKAAERLRKVHAAMLKCNALLYRSGSANPFAGTGLVIARRSTIPAQIISEMEAGLADKKRLREAAQATGIRARIEAWGRERAGQYGIGCAFYALSPAWKRKGHPSASAHPVIFWLNPYDQQNNNYGWFTVEELEQWMEGKGPIPGKRESA